MNVPKRLKEIASKVPEFSAEIELLADEVEANMLKKTTQRSPEWRGKTNC